LPRKRTHVDRLLEVAVEAGREQLFPLRRSGESDDGDPCRPLISLEPSRGGRTVHVGQADVHEDHIGAVLERERDRLLSAPGFERREPRSPKNVAHELRVLLVVIDDEHERAASYCVLVGIRVVLADDHYLVREGVRRLLEMQPEIEVVASCADLDSLLAAVDTERPDVVITDIRMPPTGVDEGIQAAGRLREPHPGVGVLVLSQYAEPSYALALLEAGSERRAYLLKERVDDLDQLVSAIRTVAAGGSVIDPKVVESLVAAKARAQESPLAQLTPRERDVLREMAQGKNNAAIAEALVLTERSVEKVIHSIFLKLDIAWESSVHRRVKAVILYLAETGS
jgi:DNA-binding NarL/FixJ family response regulator